MVRNIRTQSHMQHFTVPITPFLTAQAAAHGAIPARTGGGRSPTAGICRGRGNGTDERGQSEDEEHGGGHRWSSARGIAARLLHRGTFPAVGGAYFSSTNFCNSFGQNAPIHAIVVT